MAKRHTVQRSMRMPPEMLEAVETYAIRRSLYTRSGQPNIGAAMRELLAAGLTNGDTAAVAEAAYGNARADLLQTLNEKLKTFARECSDGL